MSFFIKSPRSFFHMRPSIINADLRNCAHKDFRRFYRRDVKTYKSYNPDYSCMQEGTTGLTPPPLFLMSWNVQMWSDTRHKNNFTRIAKLVKRQKPDVLLLQEACESQIRALADRTGMTLQSYFCNHSTSRKGEGVTYLSAILTQPQIEVNFSFSRKFNLSRPGDSRGYAVSQIRYHDNYINIVNVHLDVVSEETRLDQIRQILSDERVTGLPFLIGGDFNSVNKGDYEADHWEWLQRNRGLDESAPELPSEVVKLLKERGLQDSGQKNAYTPVYTCWTARRVDYFFYSRGLQVLNNSVYFTDASDHFPLMLLIQPAF